MDDGCYSDNRCTIAVENFSTDSRAKICTVLKEQFSLGVFIRSNGKLAIRANSQKKFFDIVRPHIYQSMVYKIL